MLVVDNEELFEFMKNYTHHWIGLYSRVGKKDFRWIDNSKVKTNLKEKAWGKNEPSVRIF